MVPFETCEVNSVSELIGPKTKVSVVPIMLVAKLSEDQRLPQEPLLNKVSVPPPQGNVVPVTDIELTLEDVVGKAFALLF